MGVLFGLNSIYNTPLSSNTELFRILTASFLLIPYKIHISTPFTFNTAMFLIHKQSSIHHDTYYKHLIQIYNQYL